MHNHLAHFVKGSMLPLGPYENYGLSPHSRPLHARDWKL